MTTNDFTTACALVEAVAATSRAAGILAIVGDATALDDLLAADRAAGYFKDQLINMLEALEVTVEK